MNIATLPTEGRFTVDTLDAAYDVDLDARIVTLTDFTDSRRVRPDQTFMFDRVECVVGEPLVVELWLPGEWAHTSSPVLGITPAPVEVNA